MKLAIMQPYLFPYIGYFQLIHAVNTFILYDDVNYIKKGWINRNRILVNNQPAFFTVPIKDASQNRRICDIEIVENERWKQKLLKTLEFSYKRAPYFDAVFSLIEDVLLSNERFITGLILNSLYRLLEYLQIDTHIVDSSQIYETSHLVGQEKILAICKQEQTTWYINPIGGMGIYSKKDFEREGITLSFLKTLESNYQQFGNEFVHSLSIIDVLMFNSQQKMQELLLKYELI